MTAAPIAEPAIRVHNRQRKLQVDVRSLQRFADAVLPQSIRIAPRMNEFRDIKEISVLLVSDRRIANLHRRFMKIAGPTDVITFQHGEIFVSVETAQRQAGVYLTSVEHELRLYVVHGVLHLLGFDDTDSRAAAIMRRAQEKIVASIRAERGTKGTR